MSISPQMQATLMFLMTPTGLACWVEHCRRPNHCFLTDFTPEPFKHKATRMHDLMVSGYSIVLEKIHTLVNVYLLQDVSQLVLDYLGNPATWFLQVDEAATEEFLQQLSGIEQNHWVFEQIFKQKKFSTSIEKRKLHRETGVMLHRFCHKRGVREAESIFVLLLRIFLLRHGIIGIAAYLVTFSKPTTMYVWPRLTVSTCLLKQALQSTD